MRIRGNSGGVKPADRRARLGARGASAGFRRAFRRVSADGEGGGVGGSVGGNEETHSEVAGVPKRDGSPDLTGERNDKRTAQAFPSIITMFLAKALELNGAISPGIEAEHTIFIQAWRDFDLVE